MKTKTISAALALAAVAATAFAASPHDGYNHAFYGTAATSPGEMSGKAAYGMPSGSAWSGHESYARAFGSDTPSGTSRETLGKAAFGTPSGRDGHAIYRGALGGD